MQEDVPVMTRPDEPPARGLALRLELLGASVVLLFGAILGAILFGLWLAAVSLVLVWVGIPLVLLLTAVLRWFADLHRTWAGDRLGSPVARPYRPRPAGSWPVQLLAIARDPANWRDWAWSLVNAVVAAATSSLSFGLFLGGIFYLIYPFLYWVTPPDVFSRPFGFFELHSVAQAFVIVPVGLAVLVLWYAGAVPLANLNARVIRLLLAPTSDAALRARVQQLATSRADTVDTQASELRRIERDLHDGAQARLASLGMSLGLAEQLLSADPEAARRLLLEARESTSTALVELRDLVRGIHPPVLADRGLDGALQALALVNPVPTTVTIDLPGRLPAPVESAAYFAVAEALANAIKHAAAKNILIRVGFADGLLAIQVLDDGRGGATSGSGGGLRGIERRLAAFDGTLTIDSPVGGPTDVKMTLPCALS
jgi:signal transduction histidine kinase